MPSLNAIRLLNGTTTDTAESEKIRVQGVREELVGFFVRINPAGGSTTLEIRGAPDDQALIQTTPNGMLMHTIITSGTAGAGQTKVNGVGHAYVLLPALSIMFVRFRNALSPSDACWAWLVE